MQRRKFSSKSTIQYHLGVLNVKQFYLHSGGVHQKQLGKCFQTWERSKYLSICQIKQVSFCSNVFFWNNDLIEQVFIKTRVIVLMMIKWIASLKLEVIYFSLFILSSGLLHIKQTLRISYKSNYYFICHLSLTLSFYFTLQTSHCIDSLLHISTETGFLNLS